MNKTSARILAVGLPLAAVAATGAALAYYTSASSGSAAGSAAEAIDAITLSTGSAVSGLVPGGSITVPVKASNPNTKTGVGVTTLTATAVTSGDTSCDEVSGASYTVTNPASTVVVPPNGSATVGSVTISMLNDDSKNQDACKGKTFTVTLSAA
ncbi:MAG: hypothetical protein JWM62_3407 [Frankiales bacterium]|nr:hypothetical protein [Frankiales bacterium]